MNKTGRLLTALAGIFLLSVVFALAQGTMMQGSQSGTMHQGQNGMMNGNNNNNNENNNWYQQMMQQREQMQSRIQSTDQKLADELQKLQSAKTDDQKLQIMQTMFANLINERNYLHEQMFPMMMSGAGMMYGGGMMGGGMMNGGMMQNGHTMHSGHMGMHGNQSGHSAMMEQNQNEKGPNNGNSNEWYQQMMQQRHQMHSRVQATDQQLTDQLQKLQAAKNEDQKIEIMQSMLANLIKERNYMHDQALSMMMMNRRMQSAQP